MCRGLTPPPDKSSPKCPINGQVVCAHHMELTSSQRSSLRISKVSETSQNTSFPIGILCRPLATLPSASYSTSWLWRLVNLLTYLLTYLIINGENTRRSAWLAFRQPGSNCTVLHVYSAWKWVRRIDLLNTDGGERRALGHVVSGSSNQRSRWYNVSVLKDDISFHIWQTDRLTPLTL